MSITIPTRYRLTVCDQREQKLNSAPSNDAAYSCGTVEDAELLGQFLLQHEIHAPGTWRIPIAGGVREVTITELEPERS